MTRHLNNIAYGDESVRMSGNPALYILGATAVNSDEQEAIRSLQSIKPNGAPKLHWRDMGEQLQRRSLGIIAELDIGTTVAIASPLDTKRQERARRKCLEQLAFSLESRGIDGLLLESRGPQLDTRDIDFVKREKASMRIGSIKIGHDAPANRPELWLPDQIIGALGDYLTRYGNWDKWQAEWAKVKERVEVVEVSLTR